MLISGLARMYAFGELEDTPEIRACLAAGVIGLLLLRGLLKAGRDVWMSVRCDASVARRFQAAFFAEVAKRTMKGHMDGSRENYVLILGIDLGITILSAENLRTGGIWRWFMKDPEIQL